ncbi:MAG TPA: Nif11-like leader peptide family natural product precursor [Coleofasciculaceae cyanobacterium]|jgi:predicted ribosomally synthesized peptide with nif11-like leader
MLLAKIINFYKRVVRDRDFRNLLENAISSEECMKKMREEGYEFTSEEFETGTLEMLENNGLKDLIVFLH